jgi:hypothetical protein
VRVAGSAWTPGPRGVELASVRRLGPAAAGTAHLRPAVSVGMLAGAPPIHRRAAVARTNAPAGVGSAPGRRAVELASVRRLSTSGGVAAPISPSVSAAQMGGEATVRRRAAVGRLAAGAADSATLGVRTAPAAVTNRAVTTARVTTARVTNDRVATARVTNDRAANDRAANDRAATTNRLAVAGAFAARERLTAVVPNSTGRPAALRRSSFPPGGTASTDLASPAAPDAGVAPGSVGSSGVASGFRPPVSITPATVSSRTAPAGLLAASDRSGSAGSGPGTGRQRWGVDRVARAGRTPAVARVHPSARSTRRLLPTPGDPRSAATTTARAPSLGAPVAARRPNTAPAGSATTGAFPAGRPTAGAPTAAPLTAGPITSGPMTPGTPTAQLHRRYLPAPPPVSISPVISGPTLPAAAAGVAAASSPAVAGGPPPGRPRTSLVETTAALFGAAGPGAGSAVTPAAGDAHGGRLMNETTGDLVQATSHPPSAVDGWPAAAPLHTLSPSAAGLSERPADLQPYELDEVIERVIDRIEQRVIDELERRGRRHDPGVF